jgi:hypothetical protein
MTADSDAPRARNLKARYAFSGRLGAGIDKTLPLDGDEVLLAEGGAMESYALGLSRLVGVRLTNRRVVILRHHLLKSDQVVEVPAGALSAAEATPRGVRLAYRDVDGRNRWVHLSANAGPRALIINPLFGHRDEVLGAFAGWLAANPPG